MAMEAAKATKMLRTTIEVQLDLRMLMMELNELLIHSIRDAYRLAIAGLETIRIRGDIRYKPSSAWVVQMLYPSSLGKVRK